MRSRAPSTLATLVLTGLLVGACGLVSTTPPPAAPDDFAGISGRLGSRGVSIGHVVSGDSGCDDRELGRTAIRFEASGLDQGDPAEFYLYIFRNRAAWERLREDVRACASAYVRDADAAAPVEISPYILVTPDPLAPAFAQALRDGLEQAAGRGG